MPHVVAYREAKSPWAEILDKKHEKMKKINNNRKKNEKNVSCGGLPRSEKSVG